MEVFNLKDRLEYLDEVMELELLEWTNEEVKDVKSRILKKKDKFFKYVNDKFFCKLILVDNNNLVGFISIFPFDSNLEKDLTPWYSTMFVKKEYRGKGYSKLLNDAILDEAKNRDIKEIYLKTTLNNYYEKYGACFIKLLDNGEKLYKIDIK